MLVPISRKPVIIVPKRYVPKRYLTPPSQFSWWEKVIKSRVQVTISISQHHDHNNMKINKYYQAIWWWELKKYLPNLSTPNTYETFPKAQRTLKHHALWIFKITIVTCCQLLSSCPKIVTWSHRAVDDLAGIKLAAIKPLQCCCCCPAVAKLSKIVSNP